MSSKKIENKISALILILFVALTFTGCDLEVQERFKFDPETGEQFTFGSTTAWEWLQRNEQDEFNFMIAAIKATGLEDLYNTKTENYTFIFMKDVHFTNNSNGVFRKEFNLRNTADLDPDDVLADPNVDLNILKEVLLYCTLDQYVDQGPDNLLSLDINYEFKTLSTDVNNKTMFIKRNRDYILGLNNDPSLITGGNGRINANIGLHNYIFSDGNTVAHILQEGNRPKMVRAYKFGEPLVE